MKQARVPCFVKGFFDIQGYSSCRHTIVNVQGNLGHRPHALKSYAAMNSKANRHSPLCFQIVLNISFSKQLPHFCASLYKLGTDHATEIVSNVSNCCSCHCLSMGQKLLYVYSAVTMQGFCHNILQMKVSGIICVPNGIP